MASTQALSAAAQDRKARLAQLKSLKRKQPDTREEDGQALDTPDDGSESAKSVLLDPNAEPPASNGRVTDKYLSGRNYDAETRGARLGFEQAPSEGQMTLERQAAALAAETKRQAEAAAQAEQPLDLFQLQPKKPNWDLKRDLERKLDILNVRTDNAVARLVRERIANQQQAASARLVSGQGATTTGNGENSMDGEAAGIEGTTLVEATHVREREDEEEARRELEEVDALLDGS